MLTMRPNLRSPMPSTTALISRIGVIMLASTALTHSSRPQSWKSPGGGPPALLTRMSLVPATPSASARPASVVMSPATVFTVTPGAAARIRSDEHTSELQSLMRLSYAVSCLTKTSNYNNNQPPLTHNNQLATHRTNYT